MCLVPNSRFRGFKLYYEDVNLYFVSNLIVWIRAYFIINKKGLLLLCYIAVFPFISSMRDILLIIIHFYWQI